MHSSRGASSHITARAATEEIRKYKTKFWFSQRVILQHATSMCWHNSFSIREPRERTIVAFLFSRRLPRTCIWLGDPLIPCPVSHDLLASVRLSVDTRGSSLQLCLCTRCFSLEWRNVAGKCHPVGVAYTVRCEAVALSRRLVRVRVALKLPQLAKLGDR